MKLALNIFLIFSAILLFFPESAHAAYSALQCNGGRPVNGTSLFDDSSEGACHYTGLQYMFSTIICQFVTMVNSIMGKLYCSIQGAVQPLVFVLAGVYVIIYGIQMVMGTAQLSPAEGITRIIKLSIVLWLVTDPTFGVSAGIGYMFEFFISFITESTSWAVKILDQADGVNLYTDGYNAGVAAPFKFIDDWFYSSLTGAMSAANAKVIGFFIAMAFVLPSLAFLALGWFISVIKMLVLTLMSFLMAVIAVSFLLALSPIFISFMLFQFTYHFFDQWLRFMVSYSLQVMVSFTILTLWIYSLSLFGPFFNELSTVIFPYHKVVSQAAPVYTPLKTYGICPLYVSPFPNMHVSCTKGDFNPIGPVDANDKGNLDYQYLIAPTGILQMQDFLYYLFYNIISLLIVSFGFSTLQQNSRSIASSLAGAAYIPTLNTGFRMGLSDIFDSHHDSNRMMSQETFSSFNRQHETGKTPYQQLVGQLVGKR